MKRLKVEEQGLWSKESVLAVKNRLIAVQVVETYLKRHVVDHCEFIVFTHSKKLIVAAGGTFDLFRFKVESVLTILT